MKDRCPETYLVDQGVVPGQLIDIDKTNREFWLQPWLLGYFRCQNEAFREARTNEVIAQTMCSVARVSNVIRPNFGTEMGVLSPENNPFLRQVSSDLRELFRSGPVYPEPYGFMVTTNQSDIHNIGLSVRNSVNTASTQRQYLSGVRSSRFSGIE